MNEELAAYLADGDAFFTWAMQYVPLAERVEQYYHVLQQIRTADLTHENIVLGRDVAHGLFMIALEGGFNDHAAFFYTSYESYCLSLLYWPTEGVC